MRRSGILLAILLAMLAIAAFLLALRDGSGSVFGLPNHDFARVVVLVTVLIAVCAALAGRGRFAEAARYSLAWMLLLVLLIAGYTWRQEIEWAARRMLVELVPGATIPLSPGGDGTEQPVVVVRTAEGQFRVSAAINASSAVMLVDTGASVVTLTQDDAGAAGIPIANLRYSVPVYTANGMTTAAPVIIERIAIGSIERRRIPGLVARPGVLDRSLLGMTFLDTLANYSISGDRLTLTP